MEAAKNTKNAITHSMGKKQMKTNTEQFLVIIRGAPSSGKTTLAKRLRSFKKKVVWLKVDNFKDFFSAKPSLKEQRYVDECALVTLQYLLDNDFSVVMEKIFYDPFIISLAVKEAQRHNTPVKVFQIKCPLDVLQERDRNRPGVKEGCRKPLGDKVIKKIYNQLEKTYYPGAVSLATDKLSIEECVKKIKESIS